MDVARNLSTPPGGLAAESITATIELRLFLIVFADRMVAVALHTRLTLYVDDATLETVGYVGSLVADHVKSVAAFAAGIIDAGMQFSDKECLHRFAPLHRQRNCQAGFHYQN